MKTKVKVIATAAYCDWLDDFNNMKYWIVKDYVILNKDYVWKEKNRRWK